MNPDKLLSICIESAELTGGRERNKEPLFLLGIAAEGIEPQVVTTAPMAYVDGALPLVGNGLLVLPPTNCAWACVQFSILESDQKHRDAGEAAVGVVNAVGPALTALSPAGALALPLARLFAQGLAQNPDDVMLSVIWSGFRDDDFGVDDGMSKLHQIENQRAKMAIHIALHEVTP